MKAKDSLIFQKIQKANLVYQPLFATLEITQVCNLACKHCYNFDRTVALPTEKKNSIMKMEDILYCMDQLREVGALWLNLTGGEPLTHPNILEIIKEAKKKNFLVRLKTNGLLLSELMALKLKEAGLDSVEISLYGNDEETYRLITQKEGFQLTIKALDQAVIMGFDTNASIILHKYNTDQLQQMIDNVLAVKAGYQVSSEITSRYDGSHSSRDYELSSDQMKSLLESHHDLFMFENKDHLLQCSCAKTVIAIGHDGIIYPCIGAPIKVGHIKDAPLKDQWKNSDVFNKIRNLKNEDFIECQKCDFLDYCSRSSGSIYANTGNYTGCDSQTLEVARLRSLIVKVLSK